MHRRLATLVLVGGLVLVAGAVPAFSTEPNGTVTATVTAFAEVPCLTLSRSTLDYGSLAFSSGPGIVSSGRQAIEITNCGTAPQHPLASGTDATGASGAWTLGTNPPGDLTCMDEYTLDLFEGTTRLSAVLKTTQIIGPRWEPAQMRQLDVVLGMPCRGSNGAGEARTFSITFVGVVA